MEGRKEGRSNLFVMPPRIPHEDHRQGRRCRLVSLHEGHVARLEGGD